MTDHRRLSDQEFIAWAVERVPRYWKVSAGIVLGIFTFASAFSVTAYQMKVNDAVQKADHLEIGGLKEDMAAIKIKVEQIDDIKQELHEIRRGILTIAKQQSDAKQFCLNDENITRRIVEGLRAAMDTKRRR